MKYLITSFVWVLAVVGSNGEEAKETDLKLDGTYTIVSGERDGAALPDAEVKGAKVTFKGDKVYGTDKDKKEFFAASFKIDSSKNPHKIMMVSTAPKSGEKASGVISMEGKTLKISYNLPGGEVPSDFKTDKRQQSFVLKKDD